MVKQMTTWTLNAVLAGMAAAVVLLPSPHEIRKALEYGRSHTGIEITKTPRAIVIEPSRGLSQASVEVTYAPAVDCISQMNDNPFIALEYCIPVMVDKVVAFDAEANRKRAVGITVYPNPEIEEMRLAVVNLCRAEWSAQQAPQQVLSDGLCRDVTVGVAY